MNQLVEDLEAINGSWGPVGTQYFVRDFINFETAFGGDEEPEPSEEESVDDANLTSVITTVTKTPNGPFNPASLRDFVNWPEYSFWKGFFKVKNET